MNTTTSRNEPTKINRKPIVIRRGPVRVMIYHGKTKAKGKTYPRFSLVFKEPNGTRRIRNFADLEEARREGELIATRLCNGESDVLALRNSDVAELISARNTLAPFKLSVATAISEFSTAMGRLPAGTTLSEAVENFAKRHPANMPRKTVGEVVAEFISDRQTAGCSKIHLRDLGIRLGQFTTAFAMPINAMTAPPVQQFVYGRTESMTGSGIQPHQGEHAPRYCELIQLRSPDEIRFG